MYSNQIYVAKISLHYEARPTIIFLAPREWYAKKLIERKTGKDDTNFYYKRVTIKEAESIKYQNGRIEAKEFWRKRIQEKYNVGPNFEDNRWFMEQVRPTIF